MLIPNTNMRTKMKLFPRVISLTFLLCLFNIQTDAARILAIFPTPSISHQIVFRPLTNELVKRGHEVIVLTPDPLFPRGNSPKNLTEIDVHEISYKYWEKHILKGTNPTMSIVEQYTKIVNAFGTILDLQLQTPEAQEVLKKDRNYFDLLLLEGCNRAVLGIQHIFDAPIIQISSFGSLPFHYNYLGAPTHPILYPTVGTNRVFNLTMWEKVLQIIKYIAIDYLVQYTQEHDFAVIRKHFGQDKISHDELWSKVKILFVNEHPIWAHNRPLPPNIICIGGIQETPEKSLPEDLQNYLDTSKNGFIYISFGSNFMPSSLPPEKLQCMIKVFSELQYRILLKWDKDELPDRPPNVKIYKWFPQTDILRHPNIKLFITQGGLQSTEESINAAVPLLGIPMLFDQWYNTEKFVHHKIGLQMDLKTLNEKNLKDAIETIIMDKSYKNNILRLRTLMTEHPVKPLDLAVWWTEHVIKYGGDHLRPPAAGLHWTEYYEVKLFVISTCTLMAIALLVFYIIKITVRRSFVLYVKSKTKKTN